MANTVEMAAACFTPITSGMSDIETKPNPNPVRPWTNPAQSSANARKGPFTSVLRFARDESGAMLFQLALDAGKLVRVIFRYIDLFAWIMMDIEEQRWVVFLEGQRDSRHGIPWRS